MTRYALLETPQGWRVIYLRSKNGKREIWELVTDPMKKTDASIALAGYQNPRAATRLLNPLT